MTDPRAAIDSYLALRRSLGYQLTDAGWLLPDSLTICIATVQST